jgi:membrane protease YdiL (CAAX protease family)
MNTIFHYFRKSPLLSTISAILLGVIIFEASRLTSKPIVNLLESNLALNFYTKNTILKFFMLLYSLIAILLVNNGRFTGFGFNYAKNVKFFKFTFRIIGITFAAFIIGVVLFMVILNKVFPTGNSTGFPEQNSIIQMILTIWIWSSLCEEVLVRGLIQSYIQHLQTIKFFRLSLPVLVSGFFFGAMHLSLISAGMGAWFVTFTVFNTTIIGLLAAYYREKTDSLIPAFWVHFLANFVGSIPLIIKLLLT